MAQQQESSVRVSLEELLREAHAQEERERQEAAERARAAEQRRMGERRREEQAEQARRREEEAEAARRAFDEEKRRVELRALHEGTIERARMEAEVRARLAEMTARQEHERCLHALRRDRQKARLTRVLVVLTAVAIAGGVGAGVAVKRSKDDAAAADARLRGIQAEKDRLEQEQAQQKRAIESASDMGDVARLERDLADARRRLRSFTASPRTPPAHAPPAVTNPPTPTPTRWSSPGNTKVPDTCPKGDPLCATIE
jgi:hypothetical protein